MPFELAMYWCVLMIAVLAIAWFAWPSGRTWVRRAWAIGWIVGAIAWAIGFFGPILLMPDANQGPLLGIFVTGPLGFAIAATTVLVIGAVRSGRDSVTA